MLFAVNLSHYRFLHSSNVPQYFYESSSLSPPFLLSQVCSTYCLKGANSWVALSGIQCTVLTRQHTASGLQDRQSLTYWLYPHFVPLSLSLSLSHTHTHTHTQTNTHTSHVSLYQTSFLGFFDELGTAAPTHPHILFQSKYFIHRCSVPSRGTTGSMDNLLLPFKVCQL